MKNEYSKFRSIISVTFFISSLAYFPLSTADENHYNDILVGDRATGLAGAYVAISDDPSGLFYNPAGIIHATDNNISGSMNAIHTSATTYKNALGGNTDWIRESQELLPNFFGILQDFSNGKAGFSYAVVDSSLENQDQEFNNLTQTSVPINKYVINFNNQDKTIYFGPSYAIKYSENLSIGVTLYGHYRQRERILHQYIEYTDPPADGAEIETTEYASIDEFGIRPVFGLMYTPFAKISLGFTIAETIIVSSTARRQNTKTSVTGTGGQLVTERTDVDNSNKRDLPLSIRVGIAYFANRAQLYSADLAYFSSTSGPLLGERKPVINLAVGSEYYLSPTWAVRGGLFTNKANTAELETSNQMEDTVQFEHIDNYGLTFSLTRFARNTALTAGLLMAKGDGKAQLFRTDNGVTFLQSADRFAFNVFMSATYSY